MKLQAFNTIKFINLQKNTNKFKNSWLKEGYLKQELKNPSEISKNWVLEEFPAFR